MNSQDEVKKALEEIAEAVASKDKAHRAAMFELERKMEARANRAALGLGGNRVEHAPTMSADEKKALDSWLRFGDERELKALNSISGPEGGYTVPDSMSTRLATVAALSSPMRSLANVVKPGSAGYQHPICVSGPGAEWVSELATRSATDDPEFAMVHPMNGGLSAVVSLSRWVIEDSAFDLPSFVISEAGRSFGAAEGAAFWDGNGINKPSGIFTQPNAETADATRPFFTLEFVKSGSASGISDVDGGIDGLIGALYALKPEYRQNAVWQASTGALSALRKLKGSDNQYILTPSLVAGQPDTLLGKPIFENPFMPAPGSGAFPIAVGDWKRGYLVTDYGSPVLIRDDVTVKGRVLFYLEKRVGGAGLDSNAIKLLKCAT